MFTRPLHTLALMSTLTFTITACDRSKDASPVQGTGDPQTRTSTTAPVGLPIEKNDRAEETKEAIEAKRTASRARLDAKRKKQKSLTAEAAWESAESARKQQNFKEAKEAYEALALQHPRNEKALAAAEQAGLAQMRLGDYDAALIWLEDARELFRGTVEDARLLRVLGNLYLGVQHWGTKQGGEILHSRSGTGQFLYTYKIDRAAAIRRLEEARDMYLTIKEAKLEERLMAELDLVAAISRFTPFDAGWTNWYYAWDEANDDELAEEHGADEEINEGWGRSSPLYRAQPKGVPVDAAGNVIFTPRPEKYQRNLPDVAKIKFLLEEVRSLDDTKDKTFAAESLYRQALIFLARDGSQRLQHLASWWWNGTNPYKADIEAKKIYDLADDEVLGLIATHIGVYKVPEDESPLKIFKRIAAEHPGSKLADRAEISIGTFYQSRQQYDRALAAYAKYLADHPKGELRGEAESRITAIEMPEMKIDASLAQPAGSPAILKVEHRNLKHIFGRAMPIDTAKFVAAFEEQWKKSGYNGSMNLYPGSPQSFLFSGEAKAKRFSRGPWKSFELDVTDDQTRRYRTSDLQIPIQETGLWIVEVYKDDARKQLLSHAVAMLEDTAVVRKAGKDADLLWVVDARTGTPLRDAKVHVFEFWDQWDAAAKAPNHLHRTFDTKTNAEGLAEVRSVNQQYMVSVHSGDRFAYVSDAYRWGYSPSVDEQGLLGFMVTDRPVYKPLDTVRIAAWVRMKDHGRYLDPKSIKALAITIQDAKGARVFEKSEAAGEGGSAVFSYQLPESAALGAYTIGLTADGSWTQLEAPTFRVEEYKAPELEVKVRAGDGASKLGEKIPVKIRAEYFFGGPVVGAKVKYRIFRSDHDDAWVAPGRWDWLYGAGYGRAYYAYPWFSWWRECGWRPWFWYPWWGPRPREAKELVLEGQGVLSKDGDIAVDIDTARAKQAFGDRDQEYTVEADVTDSSRRTITGRGRVLATRHQFAIHAETDRGYYETGRTIHLDVTSLLPDGDPIATSGEVRIAEVSLRGSNGDTIEEKAIIEKPAKTDKSGKLAFDFDAKKEGQYRLSYVAKDAWGDSVVGTTLVWVWGPSFDGRRFKFNHLEIISDKRTYSIGETAKLLISSEVADAHVLFSSRVDNGHLLDPKVLALSGKTKVVSIQIEAGHVPNFFVEATLVGGGKISEEVREIFVPPEHADLLVELRSKKYEYRAGETADLEVTTKDLAGNPVAAEVALSVFDKSVLYIQSETTPDIRKRFWGRTRSHSVVSGSNLTRNYQSWQSLAQPDQQAAWWFYSAENERMQGTLDLSDLEKDKAGVAVGGLSSFGANAKGEAQSSAAPSPAREEAAKGDKTRALSEDGSLRRDDAKHGKKEPSGRDLDDRLASDPNASLAVAEVRKSFADTAHFEMVRTNSQGHAAVQFKLPDNLTTWRARAIGLTTETRAGEASSEIVSTKKLLVRLEAPRFFRERDRLILSCVVHNRLAGAKRAKVTLEVTESLLHIEGSASKDVTVPKDGEVRVDWWVTVSGEGSAKVKVAALTDEESDAKELTFPVLVHGFLKTDSNVGSISARAPDGEEKSIALKIPNERRKDRGELVVRWSPTLAGAMIDALPDSLDYPYGCTEQTMSRFVPAAITRRTLQLAGGYSLEDLEKVRKSLNPQELANDPNDPKGAEHKARLERENRRFDRNPVYDSKLMDDMIQKGLARISKMQRPNGGWGWWGSDQPDIYTTSYVLFGLAEAGAADVAIPQDMVQRGLSAMDQMIAGHLEQYKEHEWVSDTDAYFAYVMSQFHRDNQALTKYLIERRGKLSVYGKSLLALALWNGGKQDDARLVLRNAEQFLKEDAENETAWIDTDTHWWWYWWNDDIESNAFFLRALATIKPNDAHGPMVVKWLLNHRKNGWYWNSTRDTAVTIAAFAQYMRATKENEPDYDLEISIDKKVMKQVHIDRKNLLSFDGELRIPSQNLESGNHELLIKRKGKGPVYFNSYLSYFTLEEDAPPSGLEIKVERKYYRLVRKARENTVYDQHGQETALLEGAYQKVPLSSGDRVASGDLILVELMIESKNDYTFLAFEDPKPAGAETVALKSGTTYGEAVANLELRNEKVVFFLAALHQGKLKLDYRLRAEIPGVFHAMPTTGFAMYAPELKASSSEMRLGIDEAK